MLPGVLPDTEELRGLSRKPTEWATSETSGKTDPLGLRRTQPENSDRSRKPAPVRVCGFEPSGLGGLPQYGLAGFPRDDRGSP